MSKKPVAPLFGPLGDYELDFAGERIALNAWWANVAWTFFFRQYHLLRDAVRVAPDPGDRVIDAGACFGDTALAFAAAVGQSGRVLSFEIDPKNAAVARRNLERNPALAERIRLRECALAQAQTPLYLHGSGPGAFVAATPSAHALEVTTIDRLLELGELERVDFIKMDIEGAEASARAGAQQALRRFRPKLAISVYHHPEHLWSIARWLDAQRLGYRFYLEHYTIHYEETVLYAAA
jgi:FkbM family methyltransferase